MPNAHEKRPEIEPNDPWDAFELEDDIVEPEPEYGDFWGEQDDDCDYAG
jgi:hypothetical protein